MSRKNARAPRRSRRGFHIVEALEGRMLLSGTGSVQPAGATPLGAPIFDAALAGIGTVASFNINSISEAGTTVTAVTSNTNSLTVGSTVTIYDVAPAGYSVTATVLTTASTNTNNDTFTYSAAASLGTAVLGGDACATIGDSQIGQVTGTFNKYAYGPYKIGDVTPGNFGWSATGAAYNTWDLDAGPGTSGSGHDAGDGGLLIGDFFLGGLTTDNVPGREDSLLTFAQNDGQVEGALQVDNNRQLDLFTSFGTTQTNLVALPNMGWIELALAITRGTTIDTENVAAYYRLPGQTTLTQMGTTFVTSDVFGPGADFASTGQRTNGSQIFFDSFRLGRPRLYQINALSDVAEPAGYVDGPSPLNAVSGIVAYMNPATGSDSNDGATPQTPIKTLAEFDLRSEDGGFLPVDPIANSTPGCGTLLIINTAQAPVVTAGMSMLILTTGMKIEPAAGQSLIRISNDKLMSPAGFSPLMVNGTTIYQSSDVDTSQTDYIWQNGIPLARVGSAAACAAAAGSFFNASPTSVDINPLAGDVPMAGTSIYQRSYNIGGANLSAVIMGADLVEVDDFSSDGTATDENGSYCIQDQNPAPGLLSPVVAGVSGYTANLRTVINGGDFGTSLGGDKHTVGQTFATTNGSWVVKNVNIGPALPSGTPIVNFSGQSIPATGATALWSQVRIPASSIAADSATGGEENTVWLAHGNASNNFASIGFDAVDAPGGIFDDEGISDDLYFKNGCVTGQISSNDPLTTVTDCTIDSSTGGVISAEDASGSFSVTDSILVDSTNYEEHSAAAKLSGAITLVGDTIDFSNSNNPPGSFIWDASHATSITLRDCVIIENPANLPTLFNDIPAGCTVVSDNNEWVTPLTAPIATNYKGGSGTLTLAQWQGLGYDRQSGINGVNGFVSPVTEANAPLYIPTGPGLRNFDRGPDSDRYSGVQYDFYGNPETVTVFADRNDPGAVQYQPGSGIATPGTDYWTGANGASFYNAGNWSLNVVPSGGMDAVISSGIVSVSAGCNVASLVLNGGEIDWSGGTFSGNLTIGVGGTLNITGAGTMTMAAGVSNAGLIEQTGTASVSFQSLLTNTGRMQINSGTVLVETFLNGYGSLTVGGASTTGVVDLAADGGYSLLSSLSVAAGSTVDIADNTVEIDFGSAANDPLTSLRQSLRAAYNGGLWTGAGLTSSAVEAQVANTIANGSGGVWAIGYADGDDDLNQTIAKGNAFVMKPALSADANMDGSVTFVDLGMVAQNLGLAQGDWEHGDFNYDGSVNFLDVGLLAQNLNRTIVNTPLGVEVASGAAVAVATATPTAVKVAAPIQVPSKQGLVQNLLPAAITGIWTPAPASPKLLLADNQLHDLLV